MEEGKKIGIGGRKDEDTAAAAAAKLLQSCPTQCDPIDDSPPGSPVPGILQARTLEWVAIYFLQCVKVKSLSRVRLLATPWTAAYQASPSMGFSRQEYWSGMPSPSPVPGRGDSRYEDFEVGVCLVSLRNNKESQDGLSRESKVRELVTSYSIN